ncbi:MAG: glycosyltransferase [Thermoleophilaceae bacterium]|nr:glycosyltransferase [Thermoleophilaceae bacterium]
MAAHAVEALRPIQRRLEEEGVGVHTFPIVPAKSRKAERWGVSPALAAWVIRNATSYNIVHLHGAWGLPSVAAAVGARRVGAASVMSPHESLTAYDVYRPGNYFRILSKIGLKAFYLQRLALIVFASELEARDTLGGATRPEAVVVHHPLGSAFEAAPAPVSRSAGPLVVGYLGRLHPKKNLEALIAAVAKASEEAKLLIAGTGDKGYVDKLARLAVKVGMAERMEWLGFVPGDQRWPFFDGLDIFAMPSHYEGFGMAGAEAMARGVPTIVSQSTGLGEIIQRHASGLIAAPTTDGFAEAIKSLDRDRGFLEALKVRSLSIARLELSMEQYAEKVVPYYKGLVGCELC